MMPRKMLFAVLIVSSSVMLGACQATAVHDHGIPVHQTHPGPESHPALAGEQAIKEAKGPAGFVLDLRNIPRLEDIIPELLKLRVVYVGEAHTTYGHHLSQLEIIRRLHEVDPNMAIGMEFFQQPFQKYLDAYGKGELDEKEMLTKTEYYDRWVYDYRLYQPILSYAREHGIPLIALNLPKEITRKVAEKGMEALSEEEMAQVPAEIDNSNATYRARMEEIFGHHPHNGEQDFERFLQVQLLWDEGMAQRAADFLAENPDKRLVVLAGIGHLENGYGIPNRVKRRTSVEGAVVLPWDSLEVRPGVSDFLLFPEDIKLPPRGFMGVILSEDDGAGVGIEGLVSDGAAEKAGIKKGDRVLSVNGQATNKPADIKIALFDMKPGDKVSLKVRRKRFLFGEQELVFDLELAR